MGVIRKEVIVVNSMEEDLIELLHPDFATVCDGVLNNRKEGEKKAVWMNRFTTDLIKNFPLLL